LTGQRKEFLPNKNEQSRSLPERGIHYNASRLSGEIHKTDTVEK